MAATVVVHLYLSQPGLAGQRGELGIGVEVALAASGSGAAGVPRSSGPVVKTASRPPGRSTRRHSAQHRSGSVKKMAER